MTIDASRKVQVYMPPDVAAMFAMYMKKNNDRLTKSQAGLILMEKALIQEFGPQVGGES